MPRVGSLPVLRLLSSCGKAGDIGLAVTDESLDGRWAGHPDVVDVLLRARADPNHQRNNGITPLAISAQFGQAVTVQQLLDANADVHHTRDDGASASTHVVYTPPPWHNHGHDKPLVAPPCLLPLPPLLPPCHGDCWVLLPVGVPVGVRVFVLCASRGTCTERGVAGSCCGPRSGVHCSVARPGAPMPRGHVCGMATAWGPERHLGEAVTQATTIA